MISIKSLKSPALNGILICNKYLNKAPISCFYNHNKLLFATKDKSVLCQQQMKISSLATSSSDTPQYYSGLFKTLSESSTVNFFQNSLIDLHNFTGLPWWATIVCSTILLRSTITLPLAIYQQIIMARLELLKYEMNEMVKELKKEATIAAKMYKWNEQTTRDIYNHSFKSNWKKLIIRDNCHPFKTTILVWVQIPLWISVSMSLRNMTYLLPVKDIKAELTFNELSSQGFWWISNLTEVDSTFILPIAFGLINLSLIELATMSKVTVPTKIQKIMTNVFRGFAIIMIPISATVPSALVLYWTTSSMFGLMQNLTLMSPKVKRFCRIPITPSELENPYQQLVNAMKSRIRRTNKEEKKIY